MNTLSRHCYSAHPTETGLAKLVLIKHGETGYYPTEGFAANSEKLVDFYNHKLGVDRATREAFEIGSICGFDVPGADPERFRDLFPAGEREPTEQERRDADVVLRDIGNIHATPAQVSLAAIIDSYGVVPLGLFAEVQREVVREGA